MCIVGQDGNALEGIDLGGHGPQGFSKISQFCFCANAVGQKIGRGAIEFVPEIGVGLLGKGQAGTCFLQFGGNCMQL